MLAARAFVPRRVLLAAVLCLPAYVASFSSFAPAPRAVAAPPPGASLNACGCYRDDAGICYCEKKSKCGCEGECEPKGCEEKRAKERERELENEVKLAKQRDTSSRDDKPSAKPADKASDKPADKTSAAAGRTKPRLEEKTSSAEETDDESGDAATCPPCPCAANKASGKKKVKATK